MEKYKVLVIEDEKITARNIANNILGLGYTVAGIAADSEQALMLVEKTNPELVLMDIKIKGEIDGIECAKRIKEIYDVPIIYITAYADDETLNRAKLTEPFGYLIKPFDIIELKSAIEISIVKHKAEKRLKENEKWLFDILQSIGDALIITDSHDNITYINPIAETLLGHDKKETLGKHIDNIFKLEQEDIKLNNSIEKGVYYQHYLIKKSGTKIPISLKITKLKDKNNNITGSVYAFNDITERLNMERKLNIARELKFLGQLTAGVAHEVRNPLNAIIAVSEALFKEVDSDEKFKPYIEHIRKQVERLSKLMRELLELGKPVHYASIKPCSIREIEDTLVGVWGDLKNKKGCDLKIFYDDKEQEIKNIRILADLSRMYQIFMNIIDNSIQNSPVNSNISVIIKRKADSFLCFQIIDEGSGIKGEHMDKIFEPFFTTRKTGSGLGLTIVKQIIENLGGKISIYNNPDRGCTVEFLLPIYY